MVTSFSVDKVKPIIDRKLTELDYENNGKHVSPHHRGHKHDSMERLASQMGMTPRSLYRVLHESQRIQCDTADRIAIALGYHIGEIWPEYFED